MAPYQAGVAQFFDICFVHKALLLPKREGNGVGFFGFLKDELSRLNFTEMPAIHYYFNDDDDDNDYYCYSQC